MDELIYLGGLAATIITVVGLLIYFGRRVSNATEGNTEFADDRLSRFYTGVELKHAAGLLTESDRFEFPDDPQSLSLRDFDIDNLREAMLELEEIAKEYSARSGFWRYIQKAARRMKRHEKVEEYECEFHKALERLKD